ncbi:MAG: hypothetical protein CVT67_05180 [Actinobacteria bacterium HGW-Actinobacteria-7]|nr:MAG: hypothetical protein CVT67_05180 [Actinobacteria bacterium HGW-Actinobacteria-7]
MDRLRPATAAETVRLWPAVRAARIFATLEELSHFRDSAPWCVRVTPAGESLLLGPWRHHGDLLAIRGLWAAPARIPAFVEDAAVVARAQGFRRVLSPLVSEKGFEQYQHAGMAVHEPIVALQGFAAELICGELSTSPDIRDARPADFDELERLDGLCFDEFWRYGARELADSYQRERMTVAQDEAGRIVGYATCSLHGASATLGRLAVEPSIRRAGIGRSLLCDSAAWAAHQQAYALTLCTQRSNTASRQLYASAGLFELPEAYVIGVREA